MGQDDQLRLDVKQLCKTLMVGLCHEKMDDQVRYLPKQLLTRPEIDKKREDELGEQLTD